MVVLQSRNTTVIAYVGTHCFRQFLENCRPHSNNACDTLITKENKHLLNGKRIDNSTENLSCITDGHEKYKECDCEVKIVITEKCTLIFLQSSAAVFAFRFTFQKTGLL